MFQPKIIYGNQTILWRGERFKLLVKTTDRHIFQGSAHTLEIFTRFPDKPIEDVFYRRLFAKNLFQNTLLGKNFTQPVAYIDCLHHSSNDTRNVLHDIRMFRWPYNKPRYYPMILSERIPYTPEHLKIIKPKSDPDLFFDEKQKHHQTLENLFGFLRGYGIDINAQEQNWMHRSDLKFPILFLDVHGVNLTEFCHNTRFIIKVDDHFPIEKPLDGWWLSDFCRYFNWINANSEKRTFVSDWSRRVLENF